MQQPCCSPEVPFLNPRDQSDPGLACLLLLLSSAAGAVMDGWRDNRHGPPLGLGVETGLAFCFLAPAIGTPNAVSQASYGESIGFADAQAHRLVRCLYLFAKPHAGVFGHLRTAAMQAHATPLRGRGGPGRRNALLPSAPHRQRSRVRLAAVDFDMRTIVRAIQSMSALGALWPAAVCLQMHCGAAQRP